MAWNFRYDESTAILIGENRGVFSPVEEAKMIGELTGLAEYRKCSRILMDHRESQMDFGYLDIIARPEIYSVLQLRRTDKADFVFSDMRGEYSFFETVCQNRGFHYKVFDDYMRPVQWLTGRR